MRRIIRVEDIEPFSQIGKEEFEVTVVYRTDREGMLYLLDAYKNQNDVSSNP